MKKKTVKNILRWVFLVVCGAVIGLNVYNMNASRLAGNHLPMPFGYGLGTVLSGSMEPNISKGDLIIVKEKEDFSINDIVVFEDGSSLVVHRIIDIQDEKITTKGDANNAADEPIDLNAIKGEVVGWIPYAGVVIEFMKTPIGIVLTLGVAILLLELPRYKEKRQDDEELENIKEEIRKLKDNMK